MAERAQPVTLLAWTGAGLTALVLLAVLGPLMAVALAADAPARLGSADIAAIRFTLLQAVLSAAVSVWLRSPWHGPWRGGGLSGGGGSWR
jgi:thiamine transport system permease protein